MSDRWDLVHRLALANCAFILTGAITTHIMTPGATPLEGNAFGQFIMGISYLFVVPILVIYRREFLTIIHRNRSLALLVLLAFVSCFGTETPAFSLRRCFATTCATFFGVALAIKLTSEEQLRMLSWLFRIISVLSVACVIVLPSYGLMDSAEQEWRGVFGFKNVLGAVMALSLLVEWLLPANTRWSKMLNRAAMFLSAGLLIRANSLTPLVAIVGTFVVVQIYRFTTLRLRMPLYATVVASVLVGTLGLVLVAPRTDALILLMGRTPELTGRTEIWHWVIGFIQERPLLGYGYAGFWTESVSATVERAIGSHMYSHNGYLDTILTIGILGLSLAMVFLGVGLKRAMAWSVRTESQASLWPLAILCFFLLYNLGECTIFMPDLQWSLCVAAIVGSDLVLFEPETAPEDELMLMASEA